jgi:hypothetical protein
VTKKKNRTTMEWYSIDLHLHTPASSDYKQRNVSYIDILQRAEARGLDIIAFTDHNTIAGYRQMREEIEQLELLSKLNRILPEENIRLNEYRRLTKKILMLPGFEFTATFGFHILAYFSPDKPLREIEHLLLSLDIPSERIDEGAVTVGASSDVLTAYRAINEAGGLVIAAHANSSNGVAMRGFPFGGQTKIAYTQDVNLHALEVTDLEHSGKRTTAAFFNGTKPEYPRRMYCIQGSDAHRLDMDPQQRKVLGVGDRVTEVLLPEVSFEALMELFQASDFARARPRRQQKDEPEFDFIRVAREEGSNIIQDFHDSMTVRGGKLYGIIADVCALANTNGGTLYVGLGSDINEPIIGIRNPSQAIQQLDKEISRRISPPLQCTVDSHKTEEKTILRILVPRGDDPPYAVDDNKVYIRDEAETGLAVRDEIVGLVLRSQHPRPVKEEQPGVAPVSLVPEVEKPEAPVSGSDDEPPRTGVEVVSEDKRNGVSYYIVRDLRNGNMVKNVTEKSARRLWHYAITKYASLPDDLNRANVEWLGSLGVLRRYKQGKSKRYDLVQRCTDGNRFYYGVTEDGIHGRWNQIVEANDN